MRTDITPQIWGDRDPNQKREEERTDLLHCWGRCSTKHLYQQKTGSITTLKRMN